MSIELQAEKRDKFKKATQALRAAGLVPAELYGHGLENKHISVNLKDFEKTLQAAGENTVINLFLEGKKHSAIIHHVQKNFVSGEVEHVDFYEVKMDEVIRVHVPVELAGEAPAVRELHGFLNQSAQEVEVEALPAKVPAKFVLDVSTLSELNQSLYVKDIADVPADVKIIPAPETVIVSVMPPKAEEEAPAPVSDVSAVKVEGEEKRAERESEKPE